MYKHHKNRGMEKDKYPKLPYQKLIEIKRILQNRQETSEVN
jgi:hypothetical protein